MELISHFFLRKKSRVRIIIILMLFIFIFTIPNNLSTLFSNSNEEKQNNCTLSDYKKPNLSQNQPNSKTLLIYQYATISNTFFPLSLPTNVSFTLVEGWTSKNVTIFYDEISHQKDWVINGSFDEGEDPWEYFSSKPAVIIHNSWQPDNVEIQVKAQQSLSKGDYGYFEQNFTIPDTLTSIPIATLSMNYKYDVISPATPSNFIYAFISINVRGIEKNISKSFSNLVEGSATWIPMSLTYDMSDIGQEFPGNITLRAGVYVNASTTTAIRDQFLYLDDIQFTVWTKPNQPNLIVAKDLDDNSEYGYQNITFGKGKTIVNTSRSRTETSDVKFTISKNETITEELKVYNITITSEAVKVFNSTMNGLEGSIYTTNNRINWQTECSISIPYSYLNNWAEISKPSDWNITSILDGYNVEKRGSCEGIELGSESVKIPQDVLNSGLWKIKADSQNYISNGIIVVWNGTIYVEQLSITWADKFQINMTLNNTIPYENTHVNCTIEYPNGTIYWQGSKELSSYNVKFGNFTVEKNMSVGSYKVILLWTNNQSYLYRDKIGYSQFNFNVWHHTNLTAVDTYIERVSGEPLLLKVNFTDFDLHTYIDFATITYNSTLGISGTMVYFGSGIYVIDVDTSGKERGDHYFSFNASKTYFESQFINNLIHLKIISQPLALEVPHTAISAKAFDYAVCYINVTGAISGTLITGDVNISTDWENPYSVFDNGTGTIKLNFSTENLPSHGIIQTFKVTIYANKTNYGSTYNYISIQVYPLSIVVKTIDFIDSLQVYAGSSSIIKINLTEYDSGKSINNANVTFLWNYDIGDFENKGNGIYETRLNIPRDAEGTYRINIVITTESGYYETKEFSFLLIVSQKPTPNYPFWMIISILLIVIGIFSTIMIRTYILLPRKRKKEELFLNKIQTFKDIENIQGIMLIQKESGIPFFTKNLSEYGFEDNVLVSGFIQAITIFGEQAIQIGTIPEEKRKPREKIPKNIIELNFKFFRLLICDYYPLRSILIIKNEASNNLQKQFYLLTSEIGTKFFDEIKNFLGTAINFESDIEVLLNKFLYLYYSEPFKLVKGEAFKEVKKTIRELEPLESRILNVIISLSKYKKDFTFNNVIEEIDEKNVDLIYGGLDTLIKKRMIIPSKFQNDKSSPNPNSLKF